MTAWSLDPIPTVGVVLAAAGYLDSRRRLGGVAPPGGSGRALGSARLACFAAGLVAVIVAVDGPPDVLGETAFSLHMVQHLLLEMVAAPLLLLGGPLTLLLLADPPWLPRRLLARLLRSRPIRLLAHPVTAFGLFSLVLVGSHLTALYNLALEHEGVHELEHVAFLATALLFWWPAIGIDPVPHRLGYPARLLYLFLVMPVMAYLGIAITMTSRVLYPYYASHLPPWGASALADQHVAGWLMWEGGIFAILPAMAVVLLRWLDDEERTQARRDAHLIRAQTPLPTARSSSRS